MSTQIGDFVCENCNNPGTGLFTLTGSPAGRRNWGSAFTSRSQVYYAATDGNSWETGIGTWKNGTDSGTGGPSTLSRDTVLSNSSSSTSPINFTGALFVYSAPPAARTPLFGPDGQTIVLPIVQTGRGVQGSVATATSSTTGGTMTFGYNWADASSTLPSLTFTAFGATLDAMLNLTIAPTDMAASEYADVTYGLTVADSSGNVLTSGTDSCYVSGAPKSLGKILIRLLIGNAVYKTSYTAAVTYTGSVSISGTRHFTPTGSIYIRTEG